MNRSRGVLYGIAAYTTWGLFPLYWPLLKPAGSAEILVHRMLWSFVAVSSILVIRRRWSWIREILREPKRLALLAGAAAALVANWGIYIYAVNSGHTIDAALGYFINPLLSILLGVVVFGERLRAWQVTAVGIGALALLVMAVGYGQLPWIALTLSSASITYGVLKKLANTGSAESLMVETLILLGPALAYTLTLELNGEGTMTLGLGHLLLLVGAGWITAVPLLFFNAAIIRVPLSVIGMLQYLSPALQFLIGLLIYREPMPTTRWIGFLLVWAALSIVTIDGLRAARARSANPDLVAAIRG